MVWQARGFLFAVVLGPAFAAPAGAAWDLQCRQEKCRATTYVDWNLKSGEHIRFFVEVTNKGEFKISPLITREQFHEKFASASPIDERIDDRDYVVRNALFSELTRARIRVDGKLIATARVGPNGQLVLPTVDFVRPGDPNLIDVFREGRELEMEAIDADGHLLSIPFDLSGVPDVLSRLGMWPRPGGFFADVLRKPQPSATTPPRPTIEIGLVAAQLDVDNALGIRGSDLSAIKNPRGIGWFVYVNGRDDLIWFVRVDDVVAVSILANRVTPTALDIYEAAAQWGETGLGPDNAFSIGRNLIHPH